MPYALSPSRLARYFYHDCERHLRYLSTPAAQRVVEGVPKPPYDHSPVTKAILEGGFDWEERVIADQLKGRVVVAPGNGPLRERTFGFSEALAALSTLKRGHALYQPTLVPSAPFLARYGLDPAIVELTPCRPDLLLKLPSGKIAVIDVKATDELKSSHRVQTGLYALMLRDLLGPDAVDIEQGGIWLYDQPEPTWFDLAPTLAILETFLRERLTPILTTPLAEVPWHLHFRCEWCEYFDHCHQEAVSTRSVSLLPYLTHGGRRHLRQIPVNTLKEFSAYLDQPESEAYLDNCGSFRGKHLRLGNALRSLDRGEPISHGGSSLSLPVNENVLIGLTLHREPFSGSVYALGWRRNKGKDIFGTGTDQQTFVAESPDAATTIAAQFLQSLHDELAQVHEFNLGKQWKDQKGVQFYVFDAFEERLFRELLFAALQDPDLAPVATRLLFHFQSETLAHSNEHPRKEVASPLVVLTAVIRELMSLPRPLVIRLDEALECLPNPRFEYDYKPSDLFAYQLSNAMRSDAILAVWQRGKTHLLQAVRDELGRRLIALTTLVDGLREPVKDRLFAWPPKFEFHDALDLKHVELSRLSFVTRYESLMGALKIRMSRARPWEERIKEGISVKLEHNADRVWKVRSLWDESQVEDSGFYEYLIVPEGAQGELDQMAYDDFRNREAMWNPKTGPWLAAVESYRADLDTGLVQEVKLKVPVDTKNPRPLPQRGVLHPRYMDFNSRNINKRLLEIDAESDPPYVQLLRDPVGFAAPTNEPDAIISRSLALAAERNLTPSQQAALDKLLRRRLTLVWGPPGTGKTHFLSHALACLAQARKEHKKGLRVGVCAFTHAACDHLLKGIQKALGDKFPVLKLDRAEKAELTQLSILPPERAAELGVEVIAGGTVHALNKAVAKGRLVPFEVLVVDEASQLKLSELALGFGALARAGRLILAGDDLQLPPILQGVYPESEDGLPGLQDSAFAYLRARDQDVFTAKLTENWRMNTTLSAFPAQTLYGDHYRPATEELAIQRLQLLSRGGNELYDWLLDPDFPMVLVRLEGFQSSLENRAEAELVAELSVWLRERLTGPDGAIYPDSEKGDRDFWKDGLFIVSPHHAQIRAIRTALAQRRTWHSPPFVDTVDKMQGQESQAVLVSYGVSDQETALGEAEFLYSLNRLNVSVTRAKSKCVVFLPGPLLEPAFDLLANEQAVKGFGHMHSLLEFCRQGEERVVPWQDGRAVCLRVG